MCAIILLVLEHPLWVLWHWMNPIIKSWPYPDGVNCSRKGTMSSISQRKRGCQVFFRAGWCNKREGSSTLKVRKISWLGKDMSIQRTLCIIPALGSGFHTFVSKVYNDWLKRDVERWWWLAFYVSARCGLLRWLLSVKFRAWLANLFSIMKNIKLIIFMFQLYMI